MGEFITTKDIDLFFDNYKKSIGALSILEKQLLKESDSFEKWRHVLTKKSEVLRTTFPQNQMGYQRVIDTIRKDPSMLTIELANCFLDHVNAFLMEGFRDYGVINHVLRILIPFYSQQHMREAQFDCSYFLGITLTGEHYYPEAVTNFSALMHLYERPSDCKDPQRRIRIVYASYFRLLSYVRSIDIDADTLYDYYVAACRYWNQELPWGSISRKKSLAVQSVIRNVTIMGCNHLLASGEFLPVGLSAIIEQECGYQNSLPEKDRLDGLCSVVSLKEKYTRDQITQYQYEQALLYRYQQDAPRFNVNYTFGQWSFGALFSPYTPDDAFSADKLFYMNPSYTYIRYLLCELLDVTTSSEVRSELFPAIYRYFMQLPSLSPDIIVDDLLVEILCRILRCGENEDLMVELLQSLFVHRQIGTAIHSTMVGLLAKTITEYTIEFAPDFFVGMPGMPFVDEVPYHKTQLTSFAWKAGLCHDTGKVLCPNLVNLQTRKLLDEEFDIIKQHPAYGFEILARSKSLSQYANSSLCHHLSFDGKFGYPKLENEMPGIPYKRFTDIIAVCDALDAATDRLGRNYSKTVTFQDIWKDILEGGKKGRYNPTLLDYIARNKKLLRRLDELITSEREKVQYEVYQKFIIPDMQFIQADSKYIRVMVAADLPAVCQSLDYSLGLEQNLFTKCSTSSYLMLDGHGRVFGMVMAQIVEPTSLEILQLVIRPDFRRFGFGSMLLMHLENSAYERGFRKIYFREILTEQFSAFSRNNNYIPSSRNGYWEKTL